MPDINIKNIVANSGLAAASVAVVHQDGTVFTSGFGYANLRDSIRADEQTLFRIGSISKMFVGLAALQLSEQGKLDLHAPLDSISPQITAEISFSNPYADTHPVRFIHLLEHTTGWHDIHVSEYALSDPHISLADALHVYPDTRISRWPPGTMYAYSNAGSAVAARIIELITGMDFEAYVRTHIFAPLGMDKSTFAEPHTPDIGATAYVGLDAQPFWHLGLRPAGAISASATDMRKLLQFFITQGQNTTPPILSAEALASMAQPTTTLAAEHGLYTGYGLAMFDSFYKGHRLYGHNGAVTGASADLAYDPISGQGYYVAVTGIDDTAAQNIVDTIRAFLFPVAKQPNVPPSFAFDADKISEFAGYYMQVNMRQEANRFYEQLRNTAKLAVDSQGPNVERHGRQTQYFPITEHVYRIEERAEPSLALFSNQHNHYLQVRNTVYQQISALRYYAQQFGFWAFWAAVLIQLLYVWVWLVQMGKGKHTSQAARHTRYWPLAASVSVVVYLGAMIAGQIADPLKLFSTISWASVTMMLASVCFALSSVIALFQNLGYLKARSEDHSTDWAGKTIGLGSSLIFVVATGYLAYYGVIGLRTWA